MFMPTTINGEEYLNQGESAEYAGMSAITLKAKIEEHNREHPKDKIIGMRNKARINAIYYRKQDLDKLKGFEPVE